jgi:hypothetical protein
MGCIRPRGVGVLISSLVEANLLPSLGTVNGTDALYAGLKTEPRHTGQSVYLEVAATALLLGFRIVRQLVTEPSFAP